MTHVSATAASGETAEAEHESTEAEHEFAFALFRALRTRRPLETPVYARRVPNLHSAYRVQRALTAMKGEPVTGYKVSLTSKQTQRMFGANEPLYGAQVASRVRRAPLTVSLGDLMEPLVEVELNFRVVSALGAGTTLRNVLDSTTVAPGLELPDSRFRDWFPSLPKELVCADAAVGGYILYGRERPTKELFPTVADLTRVTAQLWHNGRQVAEGGSQEVLGNPLRSVAWLANTLDTHGYGGLHTGQRVSSGTFVLPPKLTAGTWRATYDSGLGDVSVTVTQ